MMTRLSIAPDNGGNGGNDVFTMMPRDIAPVISDGAKRPVYVFARIQANYERILQQLPPIIIVAVPKPAGRFVGTDRTHAERVAHFLSVITEWCGNAVTRQKASGEDGASKQLDDAVCSYLSNLRHLRRVLIAESSSRQVNELEDLEE
ncbi:hypothetical protein AND_006688 [Anopheles darlingi]|uniref:Uncharacterized protein n=1 Tax=Anopheles darlingi TaxID=43151 RepID=W5JFQ7_ANODA|nr:hypothetical protein AND_006688 [Anopheles darlingi]